MILHVFIALVLASTLVAQTLSADQTEPGPGISDSINPLIAQVVGPTPQQQDSSELMPGRPGTIPEVIEPKKTVVSPEEVRKAQTALKARGYDPGQPSGRLDDETQKALSRFQRDKKLPTTGVLDEVTASELSVKIPKKTEPNSRKH